MNLFSLWIIVKEDEAPPPVGLFLFFLVVLFYFESVVFSCHECRWCPLVDIWRVWGIETWLLQIHLVYLLWYMVNLFPRTPQASLPVLSLWFNYFFFGALAANHSQGRGDSSLTFVFAASTLKTLKLNPTKWVQQISGKSLKTTKIVKTKKPTPLFKGHKEVEKEREVKPIGLGPQVAFMPLRNCQYVSNLCWNPFCTPVNQSGAHTDMLAGSDSQNPPSGASPNNNLSSSKILSHFVFPFAVRSSPRVTVGEGRDPEHLWTTNPLKVFAAQRPIDSATQPLTPSRSILLSSLVVCQTGRQTWKRSLNVNWKENQAN